MLNQSEISESRLREVKEMLDKIYSLSHDQARLTTHQMSREVHTDFYLVKFLINKGILKPVGSNEYLRWECPIQPTLVMARHVAQDYRNYARERNQRLYQQKIDHTNFVEQVRIKKERGMTAEAIATESNLELKDVLATGLWNEQSNGNGYHSNVTLMKDLIRQAEEHVKTLNPGMEYSTTEEIQHKFGLTYSQQRQIMDKLHTKGIIEKTHWNKFKPIDPSKYKFSFFALPKEEREKKNEEVQSQLTAVEAHIRTLDPNQEYVGAQEIRDRFNIPQGRYNYFMKLLEERLLIRKTSTTRFRLAGDYYWSEEKLAQMYAQIMEHIKSLDPTKEYVSTEEIKNKFNLSTERHIFFFGKLKKAKLIFITTERYGTQSSKFMTSPPAKALLEKTVDRVRLLPQGAMKAPHVVREEIFAADIPLNAWIEINGERVPVGKLAEAYIAQQEKKPEIVEMTVETPTPAKKENLLIKLFKKLIK